MNTEMIDQASAALRGLALAGETAGAAAAAHAKALTEARYTIAIKFPRDPDVVRSRLLKECTRPSFAEVARYRKPIGDGIEGPSIRFAEAAIRCSRNIIIDTPTIYDDRDKRIVNVEVTDLEANIAYSQNVTVTKTIERRNAKPGDVVIKTRTNSRGQTIYILEAEDDDILNKQNALISKALRTLALRLIPGDLIDECMNMVIATQQKGDAEDPDAAKRKLFDAFAGLGIGPDQIKEYLGHPADTLVPKELTELRALYAAIREGETSWAEVMDDRSKGTADGKGDGKGKSATGKAKGAVETLKDKTGAGAKSKEGAGAAPSSDLPTGSPRDATPGDEV